MPVEDLSNLPESEREAEAKRIAFDEARLPFDLHDGPLVRARLLALGRQQHVLLVTLHHIICDGWSIGIIIRDLAALYDALSKRAAMASAARSVASSRRFESRASISLRSGVPWQ